MPQLVNMPWVFAVVFIAIFALVLAFAVAAVVKNGPTHRQK